MFYIILAVLFFAVFAFLTWRILSQRIMSAPPVDSFVCPHCDEQECVCYKKDPTP